ncbi:MAG: phosphorylase, partial [Oscillospiraceae bacterium]|nr:phosphorylase [Oscillospiraceae bacterium]
MSLIQHKFPILEYDTEKAAVMMPNGGRSYSLPSKCVFGFLGDSVKDFAMAHHLETIAEYRSMMKKHPAYKVIKGDNEIVLFSAPVGAPAATATLDWLIGHGVHEIIAIGGCGTLVDRPENELLIPTAA